MKIYKKCIKKLLILSCISTISMADTNSEIEKVKVEIETLKNKILRMYPEEVQNVNSIIMGKDAEANVQNNISIGTKAGKNSKMGNNIYSQIGNIYLGESAGENAEGKINIFNGYSSGKDSKTSNAIYIGNSAGEEGKGDHNIGVGFNSAKSTDGLNNVAIGQNSGNGIKGNNNVSIGSQANNFYDIHKPNNLQKSVSLATAVGVQAETTESKATALGGAAKAKEEGATAVGFGAIANGKQSLAAGYASKALADTSISVGNYSTAKKTGSIAIGNNAIVNVEDGVALGNNSYSERKIDTFGYDPSGEYKNLDNVLGNDKEKYNKSKVKYEEAKKDLEVSREEFQKFVNEKLKTANSLENLKKNQDFVAKYKELMQKEIELYPMKTELDKMSYVWNGTRGALAIGNDDLGITRQITGVAAGTYDTDAVNVAQLKNVTLNFETNKGEGKVKLSEGKLGIVGHDGIVTDVDEEGRVRIGLDGNQQKVDTQKLNSGVASAVAIASLPQINSEGINISVGYGNYDNQNAVAVGLSGTSENGKLIYKAGGSISSSGNTAVGMGVGYTFGKNKKVDESISIRKEINDIKDAIKEIRAEIREMKSTQDKLMIK